MKGPTCGTGVRALIAPLLLGRLTVAALLVLVLLALRALACLLPTTGAPPLLGLMTGADIDLLSGASLGGGLTPVLAVRVHDAIGSYTAALYMGAALSIAGALSIGSIAASRNRAASLSD